MSRPTLTFVLAGERLELPEEAAAALAEFLWKGRRRGAVTGAAKVSNVLGRKGAQTVEFDHSETDAVRDALRAVGLG